MPPMPKELVKIFQRVKKEKNLLPKKYIHPDSKEIFIDMGILWLKYKDNQDLVKHSAIHVILDFELNYFKDITNLLRVLYNFPQIEFKDLINKRPDMDKFLDKIDPYYDKWIYYFLVQLDIVVKNLKIRNRNELIKLATICNNKLNSLKRFIKNKKNPKLWIYDVLEEFIYELKENDYVPTAMMGDAFIEEERVMEYEAQIWKDTITQKLTKTEKLIGESEKPPITVKGDLIYAE